MTMVKSKKKQSAAINPLQEIAQIAELRAVHEAFSWLHKHAEELCAWQMELATIPAPPFGEAVRSAWLRQRFENLALHDVHCDELGNVFGTHTGASGNGRAVAVTAHIDTVFPEGTPLHIRREAGKGKLLGPGISDNASGVTAMLAVVAALQAAKLETISEIVFIGNVGEEGEGDLRGMRHIFSTPRWSKRIAYTLVVDGAGTNTIVTQALGSSRFEVTMQGPGGHSWNDFGVPNPIAALARAITSFYKTQEAAIPAKKSSYNVGVIEGGTSVNSIPERASMRVDLRSLAAAEIERMEKDLRKAVARAALDGATPGITQTEGTGALRHEFKRIGERPAAELSAESRILQIVRAVDSHLAVASQLHCSSTDANIPLALGREAVCIGTGGAGGSAHTLNEWYDPSGRELGLKRILLAALALAGMEAQ